MTRSAGRPRPGAWVVFLAVAGIVTVVYFFMAIETQSILDDALAVASAGAMFLGVARNRPEPRFAWVLLAFGVLLFAGGDIVYGTSQPVPSAADMLYVSAYPLLALGLVALARSKLPGRNESKAIDVIAVATGVAVLGLVFLAVPTARSTDPGSVAKAVSVGYPVADVILLVILARPVRSLTARGMPLLLIGGALGLRLVADVAYAMLNFGTAYTVGNAADAAWLVSFACFGAALLHPAVAHEGALAWTGERGWSAALSGAWASAQPVAGTGPGAMPRALVPATQARTVLRASPISRTQAVRFRLVMAWAGVVLLIFAAAALLLGRGWDSTEVLLLGGAYGTTGSFVLAASAIRA